MSSLKRPSTSHEDEGSEHKKRNSEQPKQLNGDSNHKMNTEDEPIVLSDDEKLKEVDANKLDPQKKLKIEKMKNELYNEEAKLITMQKVKSLNTKNSIQKPPLHQNPQVNNNHRLNKNVPKHNNNNYQNKAQQLANQNAMEAMLRMQQQISNPNAQSVLNANRLLQMGSSQQSVELIQKYIAQNLAQQNNQRTQQMTYRQQQATAKLQLRKQLEKTLLEIPPPQPPPPEINFLPSATSNEFICLVGLEQVVSKIQPNKTQTKPPHIEPYRCHICRKDFSPLWKKTSKDSDSVTCLQCVLTNQKRLLKAEHTTRLKTCFVQALQKEQEIEQQMKEQAERQEREAKKKKTTQTANNAVDAAVMVAAQQLQQQQQQLKLIQQDQIRQHQQYIQQIQRQQSFMPSSNNRTFNQAAQAQMRGYQNTFTNGSKNLDRQLLYDLIPSLRGAGSNQNNKHTNGNNRRQINRHWKG